MKSIPKRPQRPVSIGEQISLDIVNMNSEGEGVGHVKDGFTVFVPHTAPGDRVTARVISAQKTYARALSESIDSASSLRVEPPCRHFSRCGGCPLQHINYREQLRLKQDQVVNALRRIARLEVPVHPVLGMDDPWRYRNKAQVPVGLGEEQGQVSAGFFAKRSHTIVDMDGCPIQHPSNDAIVNVAKELVQDLEIPVYDERKHTGVIRHILLRTSFASGNSLVVLVTNGRKIPKLSRLVRGLTSRLPMVVGIVQNINTSRGNVILGTENNPIWGMPHLVETLGELTFYISPASFYQVNPAQTLVLYEQARMMAGLTGSETLFDLYCGIGTIASYMSRSAAKVVGVESVPAAVDDARMNATRNGITNAEFHLGLAEEVVPDLLQRGYGADVVVVDPPRKGCHEGLLDAICATKVPRIVYVSCNPATLARDLRYLCERGYNVRQVQPVDMFPHTSHVECVAQVCRG